MSLARASHRRPARALACALVGLALPAAALPADKLPAKEPDTLAGTPDEMAGWFALDEGKYIRARELGEKIVKQNPRSFAGHHVLGVALHYGEGDLARSVLHLEEGLRLFEARYGKQPAAETPWRWHEAMLRELAYSLNEIDRPADEIAVLDRYDLAYSPKRQAQRVWPLMKLHRYNDARTAAKLAVASGRPEQQMIARSDLCAAECEAGDREHAYQACTEALVPYRTRSTGGQVEYSNASEAALAVYRFDEAERFLAESTKRAVPDSWGNPYQHLALLYMAEGRIPEAIAALKGGQELRLRRPAWLDQHGQARLDWTVAALLLVVGQTERASQIAARALARPDRMGVHSGTEAQAQAAASVLVAMTLRDRAARDEEEAVSSSFGGALGHHWRALRASMSAWHEERRAAVLLADEDFLERSLRPYYVGGADVSEWMVPDLIDVIGAGVVLRALARVRAVESAGSAAAYYDAFEAEAEFGRGHWRAALTAAERALVALPGAESLLVGRVAAVAAESSRRLGDAGRAGPYFTQALAKNPGVLRRLGVALPVRIESDGGALASRAAALLGSSPRFRLGEGAAAHTLALRGDPNGAQACLLGASHDVVECASIEAATPTENRRSVRRWTVALLCAALAAGLAFLVLARRAAALLAAALLATFTLVFYLTRAPSPVEDGARRLVAALHQNAFAFKSDLSQADLTTLDGSPTAARADRQVKTLLDTLGGSGH